MSLNTPQKTPWPTKAVMQQIYEKQLWGHNTDKYYSGEGSHKEAITKPYVNTVVKFLKSHKNPLTVCDLGCGDFNIGRHLFPYCSKYIAVDIVENLIAWNKKRFKSRNLEFRCFDIAKEALPEVDCIIIRQVFQHLSNEEVQKVVTKITKFKYIILTEHIPNKPFVANRNIITGQGIRLKKDSGVDVLKAPFNLKPIKTEELDTFFLKNNSEKIVTTLHKMF